MAKLEIAGLCKDFGDVPILRDINLDFQSGELIVFVGPSGCGKSTLLRCISGLDNPTAGTIAIDGAVVNDVPAAKRSIAMVFQSYALYPHMTVFENIAYSLRLRGVSKSDQRQQVVKVAEKLGLVEYLARYPRALSGGQRQRVAIGRAIVRDPKVFLFDEPLSNLDAALRVQMRMELVQLKKQLPGTTMIYVTHDQVEAMTMADRIVVLRGGVVEQVGVPMDLYEKPRTQFVAGFIGSPKMNILAGEMASKFRADSIGIRPERLRLSRDGESGWAGTVAHVERLGSDSFIYVKLNDASVMTCRQDGGATFNVGETVNLEPAGAVHRFDKDGISIQAG